MSFEDLLVSADELDAELLSTALKPFVRIERETLRIRPQAAWRALTVKGKIVAFLLARKAMRALGLVKSESCLPGEIIRETGLPAGSVHPSLKVLYESRPQIVDRDSESRYWIPNWGIDEAISVIGGGQDDGE